MTRREAKTQMQLRNWEAMIHDRMARGLTVREYCREIGIAAQTYYNRQGKVRDAAAALMSEDRTIRQAPRRWTIPIEKSDAENKSADTEYGTLKIEIGGATITVSRATDLNLLADICRVVKAL